MELEFVCAAFAAALVAQTLVFWRVYMRIEDARSAERERFAAERQVFLNRADRPGVYGMPPLAEEVPEDLRPGPPPDAEDYATVGEILTPPGMGPEDGG